MSLLAHHLKRNNRNYATHIHGDALPYVDLVAVATSPAIWLNRRTLIRSQWPKNMKLVESNSSAILKFAIGQQSSSNSTSLNSEQDEHGDLLLLDCEDFDDALLWEAQWGVEAGPSSTTQKVQLSIIWAVKNYKFAFFFRLGDDSYFRVDKFCELLLANKFPTNNAVIGKVVRAPILGMEQEYVQGMGYAMTYDICTFVVAASPWLLVTAPEDGVVARWMFAIGARLVNHLGWRSLDLGETCDVDMVVAHKLPADLWSNITENGLVDCSHTEYTQT